MEESGIIFYNYSENNENDFSKISIIEICQWKQNKVEFDFVRLREWLKNQTNIKLPHLNFMYVRQHGKNTQISDLDKNCITNLCDVLGKGFIFNIIEFENDNCNPMDIEGELTQYIGGYEKMYERVMSIDFTIKDKRIPETIFQILKIVSYGSDFNTH